MTFKLANRPPQYLLEMSLHESVPREQCLTVWEAAVIQHALMVMYVTHFARRVILAGKKWHC